MLYLISYDVKDDRRRTQICNLLKDRGYHLQKSVFAFDSDTAKLAMNVYHEVLARLDQSTDRLLMAPMCRQCYEKMQLAGCYPQFQETLWII